MTSVSDVVRRRYYRPPDRAPFDATIAAHLADPGSLPSYDLVRADLIAAIEQTSHWPVVEQRRAVQVRYDLHLQRLARTLSEAVEAAAGNARRRRAA